MASPFTNITNKKPSTQGNLIKEVYQESDFGTAVSNVITLVNGTTYKVMNNVSLSSQLSIPTGASVQFITANRQSAQITYTNTTLAMFAGTNIGTLALLDIVVNGNNTGTLFSINGGVLSIKFPDFNKWSSLGTVTSLTDFFAPGCFFESINGLTFVNCSSCTSYGSLGLITGTNSVWFTIEGATSGDLQFDNNILDGSATSSYLDIKNTFPTSNTVNIAGNNVVNGNFFASGSLDQNNTRVICRSNKGVADSRTEGSWGVNGNSIATVISTVNTYVDLNFGTSAYESNVNSRFTLLSTTTGELRYDGIETTIFDVSGLIAALSQGQQRRFQFRLLKNNAVLPAPDNNDIPLDIGADLLSSALLWSVELATNDTLKIQVANIDNTDNLTINTIKVTVK